MRYEMGRERFVLDRTKTDQYRIKKPDHDNHVQYLYKHVRLLIIYSNAD